MGCCQSATATRAAAPGAGAAAAPGAGGPVLAEVPVHERCIAELKRIFEGVNANEQGHANKTELAAALEKETSLDALLKESQMSAIIDFVNGIVRHEGEFVSWEEFMQFARVAVAQEVREAVVQEVKHEIEEFKQDAQGAAEELKKDVQQGAEELKQELQHVVEEVTKEAQHEADEFKKDIAADVAAGRKALGWLKARFQSLVADEQGAVSKEELASKLKESEDVDGQSICELVGQAGLNPSWSVFEKLDTSKDGCVSWEEFKAHVCGEKELEEEEIDILVDDTAVTQRCWGCC